MSAISSEATTVPWQKWDELIGWPDEAQIARDATQKGHTQQTKGGERPDGGTPPKFCNVHTLGCSLSAASRE